MLFARGKPNGDRQFDDGLVQIFRKLGRFFRRLVGRLLSRSLDALCAEAASKPQAISAAIASAPVEMDRKTGKLRKTPPAGEHSPAGFRTGLKARPLKDCFALAHRERVASGASRVRGYNSLRTEPPHPDPLPRRGEERTCRHSIFFRVRSCRCRGGRSRRPSGFG